MRRPDFTRAEYSPRRLVTNLFQLSNDLSESEADVSFDIFKEAEAGAKKSNSVCDVGPEVPGVIGAESFTGCAEWLAGIAPSEDVHAVTKLCPWEGLKIRPDRCCVHESRLHFADQVRAAEGFDLTKSDRAQISDNSVESKLNAAVSGTKSEVCNCLGIIHII